MGLLNDYINKRINAGLDKFKNISTENTKSSNVLKLLRPEILERISKDIGEWRSAVENAEDIDNPDREELMKMYKDFIDDYQLFSAMQSRINKAITGSFKIMDESGDEDEEEMGKFIDPKGHPLPWFRDFMRIVMLSKFYGYEVIQLGDIVNKTYDFVEKFPEENLIPYYHSILLDSRLAFMRGGSNAIDIDDPAYNKWIIGVGSRIDLGIINKCAPYIIYKSVFGSWSEHADRFGMPLRVAKTDLRDNGRRQNLIDSFEAQTGAAYIIGDFQDEINIIEQKGGGDPHNIYGMLIEKCDKAISKIVLSQTGTTDEKSYSGSADVHKGVFEDLIYSDKLDISTVINKELIPRMKKVGIISSSKKIFCQWDFSEQITINNHVDNIEKLKRAGYAITSEEVRKKTGYEVEENQINIPDNKIGSIMNEVANLYKKKING